MNTVIALVAMLAFANALPWPLERCGTDADVLQFENLAISQKPAKSSNPTITLSGTAGDHLEFKEVTLTAKLNGIVMSVQHNAFTNKVDAGDPVQYVFNNEIPGFVPSVHIHIYPFRETTTLPSSSSKSQREKSDVEESSSLFDDLYRNVPINT